MSNDQAKALRCTYSSMKEKLLKYEMHVRRKPMFPIAIVLDPRFKLEHIPHGEHKFVMKTLVKKLESLRIVEASSSMPIDIPFFVLARHGYFGFKESQVFKINDAIYGAAIKLE